MFSRGVDLPPWDQGNNKGIPYFPVASRTEDGASVGHRRVKWKQAVFYAVDVFHEMLLVSTPTMVLNQQTIENLNRIRWWANNNQETDTCNHISRIIDANI